MLKAIAPWAAARLRGRPDKEHEITLNRLVIALLVLAYLFLLLPADPSLGTARALSAGFAIGSVLLAADLLARPGVSVPRRICGMLLDLGVLTAGMAVAAPVIAALYPLYLWVILGYGFRYGLRYLFSAAGLSVLLFGLIVHRTEYWAANYPLGLGLLGGLVILPLYAASLVRKLSLARDVAQKANQAKSLFLASVSHELRTPLNAVTGMSDLLRNSGLAPEQVDMVRTIRASAGRLVSLIDDLLDVSRIDAGQMEFRPVLLDPVSVMRDTLRLVSPQAQEQGLRLHLHVTPRTARAVLADRRRLGEITLNLLSNAVKFTREGGVTLAVDLEGEGQEARLRVEVDDTGIGIDPAAHERIFETFTQAHNSIANDFGGTGLGLAISRRLVKLQGGDIGVRSRPGQGSTFWFTLPVTPAAAPAPPEGPVPCTVLLRGFGAAERARIEDALAAGGHRIAAEEDAAMVAATPGGRVLLVPAGEMPAATPAELREGTSGMPMLMLLREDDAPGLPPPAARRAVFAGIAAARLRQELPAALSALVAARQPANDDDAPPIRRRAQSRRILVVDDNRVNRMVISRMLEAGGHQVSLASQGEEALDRLDQEAFDLVAMDLNMPVMDGIEATKIYRMTSLDRPHLPIVALTADATDYARQRAMEAGMDACLTKPVDAVALLDLIDRLLAGQPPAAPRAPLPPVLAAADPGAPQGTGVLNLRMLEDLLLLGGSDFVAEVISTFIAESGRHLRDLHHQAGRLEAQRFHDTLHAMRSVAANVGAVALAERCGAWQSLGPDQLRLEGPAVMAALDEEVQAAKAALLRWQSPPPLLVSRSG